MLQVAGVAQQYWAPIGYNGIEQEGSIMAHYPEGIPSNTVSVCSMGKGVVREAIPLPLR